MTNLESTVNDLLTLYEGNSDVKSVGSGEQEAYSASKHGLNYARAYLHLLEATPTSIQLKLTVTDEVLSDLSNRLSIQSSTLTLIKELVQSMIANSYLQYDVDITYTPTTLYQEDQTEGWQVDFNIRLVEDIDVCVEPIII